MSIEKSFGENVSAGTSSEVEEMVLPAGPSLWPLPGAGGAVPGWPASGARSRERSAKRRAPLFRRKLYRIPTFLTPATLEAEILSAGFDARQCVSYVRRAVALGEVPGWRPERVVPAALIDPFGRAPRDLGCRLEAEAEEFWPEGWSGLRWVPAAEDTTFDDEGTPTPPASAFTRKISAEDFDKLYTAICYANSCGWILNVEMTVTWPLLGCRSDTEAGGALAHLLHLMYHFCSDKRGLPFVVVWVMERGPERGLHTHFAAHLPAAVKPEFLRWLGRALETVTGVDPDAVRVRSPDGQRLRPLHCDFRSSYSALSQWRWFKYMMKGIDPVPDNVDLASNSVQKLWRVLGVRPEPVGLMSTQRVGVTRSIGRGARDAASFHSPFRAGEPLFTDDCYRFWLDAQAGGAPASSEPDDVLARFIAGWNRP
jgi:hypothetical protein